MERQEVFEQIKEILEPYVKNQEAFAALSEDTSILEDLEINSARLVDIILAFEDEFDIEIDDEAADQVTTISDAVELILERLDD